MWGVFGSRGTHFERLGRFEISLSGLGREAVQNRRIMDPLDDVMSYDDVMS